jgi:hypothetical protein
MGFGRLRESDPDPAVTDEVTDGMRQHLHNCALKIANASARYDGLLLPLGQLFSVDHCFLQVRELLSIPSNKSLSPEYICPEHLAQTYPESESVSSKLHRIVPNTSVCRRH